MMNSINTTRLDDQEKTALDYALDDINEEVYLFGSRADIIKKGGDIDILVFTKADPLETSQKIGLRFFEKCEEKIDVIVMDPDNLTEEQQAFLNMITKIRVK